MVWCGVVWCGVVWCGVVWCGVVWCGVVWCGVVWCGVVCRVMLRGCVGVCVAVWLAGCLRVCVCVCGAPWSSGACLGFVVVWFWSCWESVRSGGGARPGGEAGPDKDPPRSRPAFEAAMDAVVRPLELRVCFCLCSACCWSYCIDVVMLTISAAVCSCIPCLRSLRGMTVQKFTSQRWFSGRHKIARKLHEVSGKGSPAGLVIFFTRTGKAQRSFMQVLTDAQGTPTQVAGCD